MLITIEEGSVGGFGTLRAAAPGAARPAGCRAEGCGRCLPDRFIDHDSPNKQYDEAGLNAAQIVAAVLGALDRSETLRKPTLAHTS